MSILKQMFFLLKETIKEWSEDHASSIAASLAYYTIFSLSPLLILIAVFIGVLFDNNTIDQIPQAVEEAMGPEAASTIRDMLENNDTEPQETSLVGTIVWFAVIFWGASGLFTQLQNALNRIWEVRAMPGRSPLVFFKNRFLSIIVVFSGGALLLTTLVINTSLSYLIRNFDEIAELSYLVRPLQLIVTMTMLTILFSLIYKILPDVIIRTKDVVVGAAFTAFLFFVGQFVVGLYLANANIGSVFGAAGSLTVILVWIYYSAQILLFGAEFTEVWARHHGSYIRPDNDAVWINEAQARREADQANVAFQPGDDILSKRLDPTKSATYRITKTVTNVATNLRERRENGKEDALDES